MGVVFCLLFRYQGDFLQSLPFPVVDRPCLVLVRHCRKKKPSSASNLSGGRREAGRQAFEQEGGCLGFPQGFPGNVAQGNQGARNLENDPWSAWYGTQNEQANGCGAPNGCSNASGEQLRFQTGLGPGGMTPQVAAYQQILNLLPAIGGPQLLSLRPVLLMLMEKLGICRRILVAMSVSLAWVFLNSA